VKIGIIGAGSIGATAARLFVEVGHEVAVSNSRGAESLGDLVRELGERAQAVAVDEAAKFSEIVLLAVPWRSPEALPKPQFVAGKIVIDAMNPYKDDGGLYDLGDTTSSEETLKRLPQARLVKAFNTIYYKHLAEEGDKNLPLEERRVIFVAGDDAEAKKIVSDLIEEIGFAPYDAGNLRSGGKAQEPGTALYNRALTLDEVKGVLQSGY
jgi:predicted dinucleotide-binding enzyme